MGVPILAVDGLVVPFGRGHIITGQRLDYLDVLDVGDVVDAGFAAVVLQHVAATVEVHDVLPGMERIRGELLAGIVRLDGHVVALVRVRVVIVGGGKQILPATGERVLLLLVHVGERGM
ncbi:hypothetical protein [Rhodococcus erythropolis]|uniref:hypothetical protein n=1 Tax=Rhodococcus erythropolis TaxID=1833 RepID=UPI0021681DC1|nr:hypothetical protein [Rhodococcus erythropolis]